MVACSSYLRSAQHLWLLAVTSSFFSFRPFFATLNPLVAFGIVLGAENEARRAMGKGVNSLAHCKLGKAGRERGQVRGRTAEEAKEGRSING